MKRPDIDSYRFEALNSYSLYPTDTLTLLDYIEHVEKQRDAWMKAASAAKCAVGSRHELSCRLLTPATKRTSGEDYPCTCKWRDAMDAARALMREEKG